MAKQPRPKIELPPSDPTTEYAKNVRDGKIIAGPHVRDACKRHLRDLEEQDKRGIKFDLDAANRVFEFFEEILCLNGGEFEGRPFLLEPQQKFILGNLFGWKSADNTRRFRVAYIETGKGSGKSPLVAGIGLYMLVADAEPRAEVYAAAPLALDTPVPTPNGWTTQGKLKVGDQVFDESGEPCNVTYLSPILVNKKCYEVEFDDGTVIVSDANHRWLTTDTRGQKPSLYGPAVVTTAQIAKTLRAPTGRLRHRVKLAEALKLPEQSLPIDPYTLGCWLGDGRANRGALCYHKDDTHTLREIEKAGYSISQMAAYDNTNARACTILGLRTQLRYLGLLDNKHIPPVYLRASYQQRAALLAGLMDTDGCCAKSGECGFVNSNFNLAQGVHELVIGLGIKAHLKKIHVADYPDNTYWKVSFKAPRGTGFTMPRKVERQIEKVDVRAKARYIRDVRLCKSVPVRCIEVDSSNHLYLVTRSHIVTHNTKRDQAQILFRDAVAMVKQSGQLINALKLTGGPGHEWNIAHEPSASFFRTIASDDSQSGPRPHCALIDEVHEHKSGLMTDMMRAGTKGRRQAMIVMITNSGTDRQSVCWTYHEYGCHVASGAKEDDSFFSYVAGLDVGDDPFSDESCWIKANPLLGVSIPTKYLEEQVREAKGMPSKESRVRRLNFCQWVESANPWLPDHALLNARDPDYDEQLLLGRRCYGGLDLSSTTALTAYALLFEPTENDPFWRQKCWFWLPEKNLEKLAKDFRLEHLYAWKAAGWLETTPGQAVNKLHVLAKIVSSCERYRVLAIGYDRWRIEDLKVQMEDEGIRIPVVSFGQGFKDMSPALETYETLIIDGKLRHDGNPILMWNIASSVPDQDPAGNRKLTKSGSTGLIDGAVASVMAAGMIGRAGASVKHQFFVLGV